MTLLPSMNIRVVYPEKKIDDYFGTCLYMNKTAKLSLLFLTFFLKLQM